MPQRTRRSGSKAAGGSTLESYREKRDFDHTPEPPPAELDAREGPLTFVVQKHDASRLHYDFRLELDGVLKSWSVPNGPSLDPKEKRLAVMVEDHPIDYATFEGVIPKGRYGAGQVIVWDNGTYSPDEDGLRFGDRQAAEGQLRRELEHGKLSIFLRGRKLKGSFTLVRTQRSEKDWLLIKHRDAFVDTADDILDQEWSVSSGFTIDDLKASRLPERTSPPPSVTPSLARGAKRAATPKAFTPMLSTLTEAPFSDDAWNFEAKLDGVRAIALLRNGKASLLSRRGLDATKQYPSVVAALGDQPAASMALDGEIVAFDSDGRPSFEVLQQRINLTRDPDIRRADAEVPAVYYAFDLLYLDGYDLRQAPLTARRDLLERAFCPTGPLHLLDQLGSDGVAAFQAVVDHGLEGVIAKRKDSAYESGRRSKAWLKIKATKSDEFVVGGYTEGLGGRQDTFGAVLLGQYNDQGALRYCGSAGSGFSDRLLVELRDRLDTMVTGKRPFVDEPPVKGATWVRPEMVIEVKFVQWTRGGYLRAPVFLRLRPDKAPEEVQHVEATPPPSGAVLPQVNPAAVTGDDVAGALEQLNRDKDRFVLEAQGHKVPLNNLDKALWPKLGRRRPLTKRDLLSYLTRVSPALLPHLRDRPLTLTRYPNGIDGKHFYQKHWEHALPGFVETVKLYSSSNEGDQEYLVCNNLPTLLWLGQLADIELHTWYSRAVAEPDGKHLGRTFTGSLENIEQSLLNYPDFIVFDLDPYLYSGHEARGDEPQLNRKAFAATCDVALWLKDTLDSLSLSSFVKTSGRTGLHVYVPILRQVTYTEARAACETIGHHLLRQHPSKITMDWAVDKRTGKVFFDHNQNVRGKTLASVYSPRPSPEAAVSMPLRWEELGEIYPPDFTILTAPDRLAEVGDLWRDILKAKHDLQALLDVGGGIS
jgi:bifunctional non-homologous end joining protein LigD